MHSKTTLTVCVGESLRGSEREAIERLKAELTRAFAAPEKSFRPLSASKVIARNKECPSP